MKPMNSTERIFLSLEQPGFPIDVVGIFILAGSDDGPLPFEHVRQRLDTRIHTMPIFWRKVAHAPLGIGEDRWVQAASLDIDQHLKRITVPAPGDLQAVLNLALDVSKDPLNRKLPLWDAWYIEGMADGRSAFMLRAHHALIDGVGTMEVNEALFDTEPVPVDFRLQHEPVQGQPEAGIVTRAIREVPDRFAREFVASTRIAGAASRAVGEANLPERTWAIMQKAMNPQALARRGLPRLRGWLSRDRLPHLPRFVPSVLHHPPKTLFNRYVSNPEKSFAVIDLPFDDVTAVRRAHPGVTINDVLMTLVTGTMRAYLAAHDDLPDRPLWTTCPVNLRQGHEKVAEGNNFTTMWIELPVHLADPMDRLRAVHASSSEAKQRLGTSQASWDALANVGDMFFPGVVHAAMAFAGTPMFEYIPPTLNLTVSTMRGPRVPMYFAGRLIENFYGRMIICPPVHLFFHSVTYNGMVEFGITSVKQLLPDPDVLAEGLRDELQLLLSLAPDAAAE